MYRNLINVGGLDEAGVFRHVKDWLTSRNGIADYSSTGLGWTLHDSSFAVDADTPTVGDWVVITSPGEDGKQALYYRILYSTLAQSILRTSAGLFWNASTNAWVKPMAGGDHAAGPTSGGPFNLYIYGDLDAFTVVVGNGTNFFFRWFGLLADPLYDPAPVTSTGAVSAGSNVVVPVDAVPSWWSAGRAVIIRDNANIERAVISAVGADTVTLTTLAAGYGSGARLAADYPLAMTAGVNNLSTLYAMVARSGSVGTTTSLSSALNSLLYNYADPDALNSDHAADQIIYYSSSAQGIYGALPDVLVASVTGITSGNIYQDATGWYWRALREGSNMYLFLEV